jgi:glycine hydroxymethyltransferase
LNLSLPDYSPISVDQEAFKILTEEIKRQRSSIQLIASENFASPSVLAAAGSVFTNKYSEGYPKRRYYGGNQYVDELEELAISRAKTLFSAEHVNVQPHSGASANLAVYIALLEPGDKIAAMRLDQGGHLTHGSPASITGKLYNFIPYGVKPKDAEFAETIDFDLLRDIALKERPKMILAGTTAYSRVIDPKPFREIADEIGAYFVFDAAHPMGLIAAGVHPSPVGIADVVTFTTHKTLRGPRSGCIISSSDLAKKIDHAVFPGLQGGPLEHIIFSKAVAFKEAMTDEFKRYGQQIVKNAQALAKALEQEGFRIISGASENHQVLIDLTSFNPDLDGKTAQEVLDFAGITCNRNQIPNDERSPFITSGLRLGTPAETTAGMKEDQMQEIASLIAKALRKKDDEKELLSIKDATKELCQRFDPYPDGAPWPGLNF